MYLLKGWPPRRIARVRGQAMRARAAASCGRFRSAPKGSRLLAAACARGTKRADTWRPEGAQWVPTWLCHCRPIVAPISPRRLRTKPLPRGSDAVALHNSLAAAFLDARLSWCSNAGGIVSGQRSAPPRQVGAQVWREKRPFPLAAQVSRRAMLPRAAGCSGARPVLRESAKVKGRGLGRWPPLPAAALPKRHPAGQVFHSPATDGRSCANRAAKPRKCTTFRVSTCEPPLRPLHHACFRPPERTLLSPAVQCTPFRTVLVMVLKPE